MDIPTAKAKEMVLKRLSMGHSVKEAMASVDRQVITVYQWRNKDPDFRKKMDDVRVFMGVRAPGEIRKEEVGSFAEFREKYLGMKTFPHQQMWIDLLEGKRLTGLHPSIVYEPNDPRHILINCPPEHSKTITLSIDYVTYRICREPNIQVIVVSKTQEMAKQFVYAIKQRLTHPRYKKLQDDFGPAGGYQGGSAVWQSSMVYLDGSSRDSGEKDPTLVALGIGGQIYGARAHLIILDDCIVLANSQQYEGQIRWLQQEVLTRLGPGGKLIVAGTRVDSVDFYRELRNPDRYPDGKSPWTYLAQPAVLEFHERAEDWVTLWPKSNIPWVGIPETLEDGSPNPDALPDAAGLYPRWDGKRLKARRGMLDPKTWSMVYMQADISATAIFNSKSIRACMNGNRTVGVLRKGNKYHREQGMDGLYVICSMDPAMSGETGSVVLAVDMQTQMRYVLDANRMPSPSPQQIKSLIRTWTEKYNPNCWVIEKNAFQLYLTRDEEIRSYLANRGVAMMEHYTGQNKIDPDFGVASVAPLFDEQLIELPSSHNSEGVKALIEQLITWVPGVKGKDLKMDLPMALWFAELRARAMVDQHTMKAQSHWSTKYLPRYRQGRQNVVYLDDYMSEAPVAV
jgi:hypothetical protein